MAIIGCPECSDLVSDAAIACPHCGFPLEAFRKRLLWEEFWGLSRTDQVQELYNASTDKGTRFAEVFDRDNDGAHIAKVAPVYRMTTPEPNTKTLRQPCGTGVCDACGRKFVERTRCNPKLGETWIAVLGRYQEEGVCPLCYHFFGFIHGNRCEWTPEEWLTHLSRQIGAAPDARSLECLVSAVKEHATSLLPQLQAKIAELERIRTQRIQADRQIQRDEERRRAEILIEERRRKTASVGRPGTAATCGECAFYRYTGAMDRDETKGHCDHFDILTRSNWPCKTPQKTS